MSRIFAKVLSAYLVIGFAVAIFDVVDHAGRGFVNEATFESATGKGIAWPLTLFSVLAD